MVRSFHLWSLAENIPTKEWFFVGCEEATTLSFTSICWWYDLYPSYRGIVV
jgi:hypothetical protein